MASSSSLVPGFRFHPTDEELVLYYLRRRICAKPFRFNAIDDIDIYKAEPWDLPGKARLKSRDLEWYFFSVLDKKHGNGSRTNRATDRGYWKTTGKDRPVYHKSQIVGMKKTLVYHSGRAPRGERTNWVMHEYRQVDEELEKSGIVQDAFVLCRVFQKSGSGAKNGEQYGAPFVEEEWEDDEFEKVPKDEFSEEVPAGDDAYLEENDLSQILETGIPGEDAPHPLNFCYGDDSNCVQESTEFSVGDQKHLGMGENHGGSEQHDQNLFDFPVQFDMNAKSVEHEYIGEASDNVNLVDVDYILDEPFLDATDNLPFDDGAFLETNDLKNPVEADPSGLDMLEEYLTFFDAADNYSQYLNFDPSNITGSEELVFDPKSINTHEYTSDMTQQVTVEHSNNNDASSSMKDRTNNVPDARYRFTKQASRMLGNIHAPPAFASEFPTKEATISLNSAYSSTPIYVPARMIQIQNPNLSENGLYWLFGKHVNIILSHGLSRGADNFANSQPLPGGKANSAMSRCWFPFILICVLVLSLTFKIGTHICARQMAHV